MAVDLGDDPFAGSSLLSLLPRTLNGSTEPSAAAAEQELDSIRAFLESITLKCSRELLEQAQAIAKSSLNIVNLDLEDGDNAVLTNGKDRPHGQRPALGRKRARFSLKPDSSQSLTNANIDSNIDGIEDPEEYFLACENLDNAGKELKKLKREVSTELVEHHPSIAARKHRPGILGKTATYKHHFPALGGAAVAIVVSQDEIPDRGNSILPQTSMDGDSSILVPPKGIDQTQNPQSRETDINELFDANEREGSLAQKEKKIDDLYYRLLSCEDLDGEKGQAFLRESLQIQQIDVGKMHLPGPFGSQEDNVNPVNSRSVGKMLENSQCLQISPSQPKSPLAVIFALQRRLSLENPLKNRYSLHPIDGERYLTRGQDRHLVSPLVDGTHCDTSGAITDGASTPARTSVKRVNLADKMHSSVLKADKTTGDMVPTWKSHKLISPEDSSHDQTSDRRHDKYPISPPINNNSCDTSGSMPAGASPSSMKENISNLEDMPQLLFPRSDGITGNKVTSKQQPMEQCPCSLEIDAACESSRFDNDKNAVSIGFDGHLEEEDNGMQLNTSTFKQPELEQLIGCGPSLLERSENHDFSKSGSDKNAVAVEPDSCLQQEANNIELDASASVQSGPGLKDLSSGPVNANANAKEGSVRDADTNILRVDATMEGQVNDAEHAEQGSQDGEAVKGKANTPQAVSLTDGSLENMRISLEETNVDPQIDSATLANRRKQKAPSQRQNKRKSPSKRQSSSNSEMLPGEGMRQKTVPHGQKKQNSISKRQSLAGAGTTWQSGVRRSTRIKSRPLQYWCGERFLYGRIHDSLATVIGIKYASPGDSKLKVKSYVSEEYADLVAQVAL